MFGGEFAQGLDKAFRRPYQVHIARKRLNDDAGDFAADLREGFFKLGNVVVFQHQRVLGEIGRHAGGRRVAEGEQAAARFHQQAVGMAVVAALEFDDFVAAGKAACQADGRHGGFCARADQAHLFDAGHEFGDFFGNHDFALGGRAKRQPAQGRFAHGFNHFGMGVADNRRPPRADVVNIARAVGIPHIGALGLLDETRHAADTAEGAHGRIDAAGNDVFGAGEKLFVAGHGGFLSEWGSLKDKRAMIPHFQAAFGGVKAKGSLKRVECGRRASARVCFALCFV